MAYSGRNAAICDSLAPPPFLPTRRPRFAPSDNSKVGRADWAVLAQAIDQEHQAYIGAARSAIEHAIRCGELLLEAKAQVGHGGWLPWIEANLSFGDRQARKYMRLAEHADQIGIENADLTIDGAMALLADQRDNAHFRTNFTGNNEWYTPAPHLALVRHVLGDIDLDPASNDIAQQQVCAVNYFTSEDDGLTRPWHGRIFMNPPFSYPEIERFIDKLLEELTAGRVTEAIALTNNFSDTAWFHKAALAAAALCFTKGRVPFETPEGERGQPTQGQTFFYFGPRLDCFRAAFADQGLIMCVVRADPP